MACRLVARHFLSHLRLQAPRPLPVPPLALGMITHCVGPSSSPVVAPQGAGPFEFDRFLLLPSLISCGNESSVFSVMEYQGTHASLPPSAPETACIVILVFSGLMLLMIIEELFSPEILTSCLSPWKSILRPVGKYGKCELGKYLKVPMLVIVFGL